MPARVAAMVLALAAALGGCTTADRLTPTAQDPATRPATAAGAVVNCPPYATLGTDGHPAVPLAPTAAHRLAPLETPTQLVVCRYRGTSVLQLVGARRVRFGLASAGTELAWSPRATGGPRECRGSASGRAPYLIGVRYPSGVLWVTTAYDVNRCE